MAVYLSFDIGTTALKTALISEDGRVIALHAAEYSPTSPAAGWMEMNPEVYWESAARGVRAVFERSGKGKSELAAIGFSSQGQTFLPIDRSAAPLHDAIVWVDNRAQGIADAWNRDWLSREQFRRISGYPYIPGCLTVFKIAWLAANRPELMDADKFVCLPDYLIRRMTGEVVTDRITALMTGMFDLGSGRWHPRLVEAAGIREEQLPKVTEPGSVAGMLSAEAAAELGLPAGVPVCVGANDQIAAAIGAGNVREGIATETTGAALAVVSTTDELLDDDTVCVGRHVAMGKSYALSIGMTSAIVLKWFRDICAPGQDYDDFLTGVDSVPIGCDGLTVLPHFAGSGTPTFNPNARGAIAGLTLGHTRDHISRAIMESCACMLRECLEPVLRHGTRIGSVRSLGGAANSDLWLQIKADLLGIPVERPACPEASALGAAMLAAVGTGRFDGVQQASEAWYRSSRVFEPDMKRHEDYKEVIGRYLTLYESLYGEQRKE